MSRLRLILLFVVLTLLVIGLRYWLLERQRYETTDNAYLKTNIVLISPKISGYITQVNIDENQVVKKDQLLLTVDDQDYQAKVQQAEAAVLEELAHIQRLLAMKTSQRAHIESASAAISAVQAKREQVQHDLQRFQNLIARGSAPSQALDKMQAESKQVAAELRGTKATETAQYQQLVALDSEVGEAQARLKDAQAQLNLAKLDVEYTKIRAPVDGVIGKRGVQLGQLVRPGMALAALVENQKIWVEANFKETQLAQMRIGQPVMITVDAYPDLQLTGRVDSFSPASGSEFSILPSENATGNFTKIVRRVPVKIVFDAQADTRLLKSGLSVTVNVKVLD